MGRLSLSLSLACLLAHEKSSAVRSIQFSSRSQLDSNHSLSNRRRERTFKKKPVKSEIESERVRACSAEKSEPFQLPSNYQDRISPSGQLLKIQSAAPRKHCVFAWLFIAKTRTDKTRKISRETRSRSSLVQIADRGREKQAIARRKSARLDKEYIISQKGIASSPRGLSI